MALLTNWFVPFGFGFLLGAAVFDFAWRRLWKANERLQTLIREEGKQ